MRDENETCSTSVPAKSFGVYVAQRDRQKPVGVKSVVAVQ